MTTRRDFLKTASMAMMGMLASGCAQKHQASATSPSKYFGLQIYGMGFRQFHANGYTDDLL